MISTSLYRTKTKFWFKTTFLVRYGTVVYVRYQIIVAPFLLSTYKLIFIYYYFLTFCSVEPQMFLNLIGCNYISV
ncbi:hypothetical protein EON70_00290 [bacterium]|nr:MAG: hypothetical protein EON70_00290 [bacterium]